MLRLEAGFKVQEFGLVSTSPFSVPFVLEPDDGPGTNPVLSALVKRVGGSGPHARCEDGSTDTLCQRKTV